MTANKKELLLIDLSGIFWANHHATADQHVSEAFARTIERVTSLRQGYDHVAICVDSPPYFRKELLPTYKAQRDAPSPQAVEQLDRVKERLVADGLLLWAARGFEADDIAATAAARAREYGIAVTLASSDKDWLQLVDDAAGIRVLSTMSGAVYERTGVVEKTGVTPDLICDWLALQGDSSDNIPGIPKVGPKTAAKLLLQYGSLAEVLGNADKQTEKLCAALIEHAGAARLARQLVELRTDAPINFEDLFAERKVQPIREATEDMESNEHMTDDGEVISSPAQSDSTPPPAEIVQLDPQQSTALAKPGDWSMGLEPQTLGAAMKLAIGLANSRLYTRFPNAEAIWAIVIRGREMGLGALTALDSFHIIEGKPSPSAHLLIARCKAHPDCEYFQFVGGDATFAEYETKNRRNPRPTRLKYTLEQAKAAGLLAPTKSGAPSNWEKRPEEMLRKTCAVQLGRIEYPEATGGLYAVEEFAA